jgi:hypothetical protein
MPRAALVAPEQMCPSTTCSTFGNQFGGRVGGHFRFADVVFHQQFNLFTEYTTLGVDIFYHQLAALMVGIP